jgi:hypothetical protein
MILLRSLTTRLDAELLDGRRGLHEAPAIRIGRGCLIRWTPLLGGLQLYAELAHCLGEGGGVEYVIPAEFARALLSVAEGDSPNNAR